MDLAHNADKPAWLERKPHDANLFSVVKGARGGVGRPGSSSGAERPCWMGSDRAPGPQCGVTAAWEAGLPDWLQRLSQF
jgi:hypothetical protein